MKNESVTLQSEINITPLVDVVLVLLIIFLVTSPLSQKLYQVNIPSKGLHDGPMASIQIMVEQTDEKTVYLNRQLVPLSLLSSRLGEWMAKWPSGSVLYSGNDELSYGTAIQTLDLIRNSGVERISIIGSHP